MHFSIYIFMFIVSSILFIQTRQWIDDTQTHKHTNTHLHTFESQVKRRVPPKRGTGPRRCVYPNPQKYTKSYTWPRASKEDRRNTHAHLRGHEKLVRTSYCIRMYGKNVMMKLEDKKRKTCWLKCQAIDVLLSHSLIHSLIHSFTHTLNLTLSLSLSLSLSPLSLTHSNTQ